MTPIYLPKVTLFGQLRCAIFGHPHLILVFTSKVTGLRLGIDSKDPSAALAFKHFGKPTHLHCQRCGTLSEVKDSKPEPVTEIEA